MELEYASRGCLYDIVSNVGELNEDGGHYFISQIVDVLCYMHKKDIVHLDLKPENIMID